MQSNKHRVGVKIDNFVGEEKDSLSLEASEKENGCNVLRPIEEITDKGFDEGTYKLKIQSALNNLNAKMSAFNEQRR
jgi:hypothetical protein